MPDEIIENEELLDLILPILRSDFQIAEENNIAAELVVDIPIFAIMGDQEEYVSEISNWKMYTNSGFNSTIMKGGHFFILNFPIELAQFIKYHYEIVLFRYS